MIKLSEQYENLAHEIKVLKKMCKSKLLKSALKEGGSIADQAANLVPKIENYGIVLLKNMHESDLESCKSIGEPLISNKSRLFGFYIIP